ncbi:hypothetical protein [Methylobacterium brachiatum]
MNYETASFQDASAFEKSLFCQPGPGLTLSWRPVTGLSGIRDRDGQDRRAERDEQAVAAVVQQSVAEGFGPRRASPTLRELLSDRHPDV